MWLGLTQAGLATYAGVTLKEALLGCLLAAAFALPLAWALHHWRFCPMSLQARRFPASP